MPVNYPTQKRKKKITPPRKPVRPADVPHRKTMSKPRPVRFEDGQIDKEIAFLSPDKPPRRNGPIKGSASAARCTGRIPRTIEEQLDTASEEFMLRVLKGESFEYAGVTGKRCTGPAPIATRAAIASTWLKKRRPDLTATAVQAHLVTEDITPEDLPSDRQLSRLIGQLIFESQIGAAVEPKAIAAPTPDYSVTPPWEEIPSVGDGEGSVASGQVTPPRELPDPENPKSGDRHDLANGSHIRFIENELTQARWLVYDNLNVSHGFRYTFKKAIDHAKTLPRGEGPHQIDPWEMQRNMNEEAENPYRHKEAMPFGRPSQIRNIREAPKAWKPHRGGGPR